MGAHRHGWWWHLRVQLALRVMPPCFRRDVTAGFRLLSMEVAARGLVEALAARDTAMADQRRAALRDMGVRVHVMRDGEES